METDLVSLQEAEVSVFIQDISGHTDLNIRV